MSEIKALDKLREWCTCAGTSPCRECANQVRHIADEIQAEEDSRFIELPVDADGVPIRVGDNLECDDGKFLCNGIKLYHNRWWVMHDNDLSSSRWARCCHHVKSRTLEDILEELVECATFPGEPLDRGDIEGFAAEIRELLGCDAE